MLKNFLVSKNFNQKWEYHGFPSKIFCLTQPKFSVEGTFWCWPVLACASHKLPLHVSK